MDWTLDFCLVCDRQTFGSPYCSQSCRLAELDLVSDAAPSTTSLLHSPSITGSKACSTAAGQAVLLRSWPVYETALSNTPFLPTKSQSLSPSSSQTSLTSIESNPVRSSKPSDRFHNELRDYENCFDPIRDLKRRVTAYCVRLDDQLHLGCTTREAMKTPKCSLQSSRS